MNIEELRRVAQPFFDETTVYAKIGDQYHAIMGNTYMHDDAEGHLVLVIDPSPVGKEAKP